MSAEDSFAICMLLVLLVAAAAVMTILFSIVKNAGKKDELAEFMAEDEALTDPEIEEEPTGSEKEPRQPWAKDADWWKE